MKQTEPTSRIFYNYNLQVGLYMHGADSVIVNSTGPRT